MKRLLITLVLTFPLLPALADEPAGRRVDIKVTPDGFQPQEVQLKKGERVTLVFTRVTDDTCITAIDIPAEHVSKLELPLDKPISVTITPASVGTEEFHCSEMGMGDGRLIVSR
ncbi:MAG TPA: cupredoxin domain-containing protein [Anaeromyxobacter sp.]|nr:cupredoxin domain-containing protein [Anaeromyxobacter sp.]